LIAPEVEGPVGRVALVIADLEHWSKLWDTLAEDMPDVVHLYAMQLRRNMRLCRGFEVTLEGRSGVVAFSGTATLQQISLSLSCFLTQTCNTHTHIHTHTISVCVRPDRRRHGAGTDVHLAARWALTTQIDLMALRWPEALTKSPLCKTETLDGHVTFCGPRVRMAVHVGEPSVSLNPLTKRTVYAGPMVNKAWRVCFSAEGGTRRTAAVATRPQAASDLVWSAQAKSSLPRR
jgi:adenylate cyclase